MELLTVIIIIGVLATLGLSGYASIRENAFNREAFANLKLIRAAQKPFRLETNGYYNSGAFQPAAIRNINTNLKLSLSANNNRNWNYITRNDGCSQASRNGADLRNIRLRIREEWPDEPVLNATCP